MNIADQIKAACLQIKNGETNVRVKLSDLRQAIPAVSRTELDNTLLQLGREQRVALFRFDNPLEIKQADREAVLHTPSGEPRHCLYWLN